MRPVWLRVSLQVFGAVLLVGGAAWMVLRIPHVIDGLPNTLSPVGETLRFVAGLILQFLIFALGGMVAVYGDASMNAHRPARTRTSFLAPVGFALIGASAGILLLTRERDEEFALLALVPLVLAGPVLLLAGLLWLRVRWFLGRSVSAPGVFSAVDHGNHDPETTYPTHGYEIEFTDPHGQRHSVTGAVHFKDKWMPEAGDPVTVHFRPTRPARHVIRLQGGELVA